VCMCVYVFVWMSDCACVRERFYEYFHCDAVCRQGGSVPVAFYTGVCVYFGVSECVGGLVGECVCVRERQKEFKNIFIAMQFAGKEDLCS